MKEIVQHPVYGEIICSESFWTGKKTLTVNGTDVPSVSRNAFLLDGEKALIIGSMYTGIKLCLPSETIQLAPKPRWYEIVLAVLPILFLLTWGNIPSLCAVFPVVGGALGGVIGALFSVLSLTLMRKSKSLGFKILTGLAVTVLTLLVGFAVAVLILQIFY